MRKPLRIKKEKSQVADPWEKLASAIVDLAVRDYRETLHSLAINADNKSAQRELDNLNGFFHSGWFEYLTGVDGSLVTARLKREYRQ